MAASCGQTVDRDTTQTRGGKFSFEPRKKENFIIVYLLDGRWLNYISSAGQHLPIIAGELWKIPNDRPLGSTYRLIYEMLDDYYTFNLATSSFLKSILKFKEAT